MGRAIRISVIMGVYNEKSLENLEQAVRSVLNQSFPDFEFFLYNDGSDEKTTEKLREIRHWDTRIRYLEGKENQGLAYGLNQCIERARGEYVARMDGDDLSLPLRFQKQVEFLDTHPEYDYVGCSAQLIDKDQVWGVRYMPQEPKAKDYLRFSPFIHPSVMFRKGVFDRFGGYDTSPGRRRCEDYELFLRLYVGKSYGYNLREPLFQYREDELGYRKRKYIYRLDEYRLRRETFGALGENGIKSALYTVRPLAVGMVPHGLRYYLKKFL